MTTLFELSLQNIVPRLSSFKWPNLLRRVFYSLGIKEGNNAYWDDPKNTFVLPRCFMRKYIGDLN